MQGPSFDTDLSLLPPSYDVCSTAMKLEGEVTAKCQLSFGSLNLWTNILEEVYSGLQPDDRDIRVRSHLIQVIDNLVKTLVPGSFVTPFGSYTMDLFSPSSDLDLSLSSANGQDLSKDYKVWVLRKLRRVLEQPSRGFTRVEAVLRATVPLIKFRDLQTGIECDLSVENQDGVLKSRILAVICLMDPRYRKLCYLVKAWAKAQNVNDSKTGTVNSLSWILLVAFHLQTRSPPILPPFSELLEGLDLPDVPNSLIEIRNRVEMFRKQQQLGRNNMETIPQLFGTFFAKLIAVQSLWAHGLCASTYAGRWVVKLWNNNHVAAISVEDFADFSNNAARAVQRNEFSKIYQALKKTVDMLSASSSEDVDSTAGSLFGAAYRNQKRPPQQLLAAPYDKRQKLTETRFRTERGDTSRGALQGAYLRADYRGAPREGPPQYQQQNSVSHGPYFMFPNPPFRSNAMLQQDTDDSPQRRLPQSPYPRYNPNFEPHKSRRNKW